VLKRYAAEILGTFGIVFAPVALSGSGLAHGGAPGLMAAALVSGLAVLAMVFTLGPISAAHFNPAVTIGFASVGRFPKKYVLPYVGCQLLGGVLAAAIVAFLFGPGHGAHIPASEDAIRNLTMEISLTFILMIVIMAVATDKRVPGVVPPLAIGSTVVMNVLIGGAITGASMNPARSFGPALFAGLPAVNHLWLYAIGPTIGALAAAYAYEALRSEPEHAKGVPDELCHEAGD
jgi:MIP family channel proteins